MKTEINKSMIALAVIFLSSSVMAQAHMVTQKEMMPHYRNSSDYKKGFCDAWAYRIKEELQKEGRSESGSLDFYTYQQFGIGNATGKLWVDCKKYSPTK